MPSRTKMVIGGHEPNPETHLLRTKPVKAAMNQQRHTATASGFAEALERRVLLSGELFILRADVVGTSGSIVETTDSGAIVNNSVASGLNPYGFAESGPDLFIASGPASPETGHSFISECTTSGTTVNNSLISGLYSAGLIAASGSDLFLVGATAGDGSVSEYTTSGALVNTSLITGLDEVDAIAVSGADLFILSTLTRAAP